MADLKKTIEIVFEGDNRIGKTIDAIGRDFDAVGGSITGFTGPLDRVTEDRKSVV